MIRYELAAQNGITIITSHQVIYTTTIMFHALGNRTSEWNAHTPLLRTCLRNNNMNGALAPRYLRPSWRLDCGSIVNVL
jgi:hypothetical protein